MPSAEAFYLNSKRSTFEFETLEISHPSFTKTYYLVRNALGGLTATDENGNVRTFDYYPMQIERPKVGNDLDQTLVIQLGDVGTIMAMEIDRCRALNTLQIYPRAVYRTFQNTDLSSPLNGPYDLNVTDVDRSNEGSALTIEAPIVSAARTGEIYTTTRFPGLKGFQ